MTPCFARVKVGPVVQSIVSLTSSFVVKMLTALVSTISNSQVFLLKTEKLLQVQKLLTLFQKKKLAYIPYLMISFNDAL